MHGLHSIVTGQSYADGWTVNHNVFRKQQGLGNKTAVLQALTAPPFKEWVDVVKWDAVVPRKITFIAPRRAKGGTEGIDAYQATELFAGVR